MTTYENEMRDVSNFILNLDDTGISVAEIKAKADNVFKERTFTCLRP